MSSIVSFKKVSREAKTRRKLPHVVHATISFLLFVLVGTVMSHAQAVTEDLSEPRSFIFRIGPRLPAFIFKLTPLRKPSDAFGNPQSTIHQIQVFRAGSKVPIQNLTGCDLEGMQPPGRGAEFFLSKDVNFDGYQDIFLETWHGATGNWGGCIWLYNPATRKFDYSDEFSSKLSGFSLYPKTKTISTFGRGGMAGKVHVAEQYAIRKNRPVLIWSQHQEWDDSQKRLHCIVKERVGAKMVVLRDEWSDIDGRDPPCVP